MNVSQVQITKILITFAAVGVLCVCALQCAGNGNIQPKVQATEESRIDALDWSKAFPARVSGKIEECVQSKLCIISNAKSRSMVSHYVYGNLVEELARNKGRFALVFGKALSDANNPWKKHLLVEKIDRITDDSAGGFVK